jgi:hypothetical protein
VSAVKDFFKSLGNVENNTPLFSFKDKGQLKMIIHSSFVNALKQVLEVCGINSSEYSGHLCGINSSEYSGHSFRRGGASHAFKCNIPAALIKLQGDWKSNAYLRYIDIPLDVRWNMMNVFSDNM